MKKELLAAILLTLSNKAFIRSSLGWKILLAVHPLVLRFTARSRVIPREEQAVVAAIF